MCFGETVSENTLFTGSIKAETGTTNKLVVVVYDDEWKQVGEFRNQSAIIFSLTTKKGGDLFACVLNNATKTAYLTIDLRYGVEAKDYTSVAKRDHLKPMEVEIAKLSDIVDSMKAVVKNIIASEDKNVEEADTMSDNLVVYSGITVMITIGVAVYQTLFLKRFLRSKKVL